jgi:hypothetical protein
MIKHIVLWTFRESADGRDREENIALAAEMLKALKDKIPAVRHLEVGRNINRSEGSFDLALYSEFDSREGLEGYQKHPEHLRAAEFLSRVRDRRAVTDYQA